jgi:hypothetical protein
MGTHHIATVTRSSRLPNLLFHAQCDCGTAGTFGEKFQALEYMRLHEQNVKGGNAANTFKLVDDSDKPESKPALPSTHVLGVGSMPASHAAVQPGPVGSSKPPAPPAPPSAKKSEAEKPADGK